MGNGCSDQKGDPNTTNHCDDYFPAGGTFNDGYHMTDFCAPVFSAGAKYRVEWCDKLGSAGEWGVFDTGGNFLCHYNDCNNYQVMDSCCGACCPIFGTSVVCTRKQFNGVPIDCCLKDKV
jgi:hypothetical protein